jgi:hypothetical protein
LTISPPSSIATVSATGLLTAVTTGSITIIAQFGGQSVSTTVNITP